MKLVGFEYAPVASHVDGAALLVVCTTGDVGDFACYQAIVRRPAMKGDIPDVEAQTRQAWDVAFRGSKLPWRVAVLHFPSIKEKEYRR